MSTWGESHGSLRANQINGLGSGLSTCLARIRRLGHPESDHEPLVNNLFFLLECVKKPQSSSVTTPLIRVPIESCRDALDDFILLLLP